jgi:uncharacterized protein (DUF983 family)
MRQIMKTQARQVRAREGSTICPVCGQGIMLRTFEASDATVGVCNACGWNQKWDRALDEGREPGASYIPGVTGRIRGTTVVSIGLDGKIKEIRNA